MQQRYATFLVFSFFLLAGNALFAQAGFTASISPSIIGKNETAELKLMIENAGEAESITPPSLKDFIVLSGPNQQNGMISINGVSKTYIGYVYILRPKAKGEFTIAAATAKADGKTLRSNPVKLKVVNEPTGNAPGQRSSPFAGMDMFDEPQQPTNYSDYVLKKGENVQEKVNKNLFIKVVADKTTCYVGEPVVVTYKLYTRLKSESNIVKSPAFNGFSVIDLMPPQSGVSYTVEKLDGREYNVYILRKSQLYPLQAGVAELEPASVDNNLHFIKQEYLQQLQTDIFGDVLPNSIPAEGRYDEKVTVESKPLSITVKPLPDSNRPASFNGAVGRFMIDAFVEKDSLTTDDAGTLKMMLSGEGNMTLIPAPEIQWPAGVEGYEPQVKDGVNKLMVPVSGSRIFDYSFTAAKAGDYRIEPFEFSYFDLDSGKYKTIRTKPYTVHIAKGTGKRPVIAGVMAHDDDSIAATIFTHRWMIVVPVALLILTGLLIWVRVDKKKQKEKLIAAALQVQQEAAVVQEPMIPVNPLQQSEYILLRNEPRGFYETLDKELHVFLAQRLQLPAESISKKSIADGLDRSGISLADGLAVQRLLEDVSLQLYTPFADETKMQAYYVEAVRLINVLKG